MGSGALLKTEVKQTKGKRMSTLRSAIQSELDAAVAEVSGLQLNLSVANSKVDQLNANLNAAEATFADWLDLEVQAVKDKADALIAELAKYVAP